MESLRSFLTRYNYRVLVTLRETCTATLCCSARSLKSEVAQRRGMIQAISATSETWIGLLLEHRREGTLMLAWYEAHVDEV
jgi:hypothetical protein